MKSSALGLLLFFSAALAAQSNYSYITDHRFTDPTHLFGYNFRPAVMEVRDVSKNDIAAGSYGFGVTQNNLYVDGEGIKGVYTMNNIKPTEYGFQILLMNARDPTLQGHLKIILNDRAQVEALIFKRTNKEKEIIFYQAEMPEALRKKEEAWFTDRNELFIAHTDSLWGKVIHPFFRIHEDTNIQERLQMADSTSISFVEKVTIIDKSKKKKDKNKDKDKNEAVADSSALLSPVDSSAMSAPADSTATSGGTDEKKVKIIREHFVQVRSILKYPDGKKEDKTWEFQIEKVVEKTDQSGTAVDDRYRIELKSTKGESLFLYLNGKRTASFFEMGDKRFEVRGF